MLILERQWLGISIRLFMPLGRKKEEPKSRAPPSADLVRNGPKEVIAQRGDYEGAVGGSRGSTSIIYLSNFEPPCVSLHCMKTWPQNVCPSTLSPKLEEL